MEHFRTSEQPAQRDIFETEAEEQLVSETREFLNGLDEEALRDIFERELKLSGVESPDEQTENRFIPYKEVTINAHYQGRVQGTFSLYNGITLNLKPLQSAGSVFVSVRQSKIYDELSALHHQFMGVLKKREGAALLDIPKTISASAQLKKIDQVMHALRHDRVMSTEQIRAIHTKIEFVHALVHEELHALSSTKELTGSAAGSIEEDSALIDELTSGVQKSTWMRNFKPWEVIPSIETSHKQFIALNEGITELNARRLSREYLTYCLPKEIMGTDMSAMYDVVELGSYKRERWVAEQLVTLFAVIAEVPPEVVERSLFRSYLTDGDFLPSELTAAVRHDIPELAQEEIEQLLLKLQIAISADSFTNGADADINRIFIEFADLLPPQKRDTIKDSFQGLFYKYSFAKELQDGVVEG